MGDAISRDTGRGLCISVLIYYCAWRLVPLPPLVVSLTTGIVVQTGTFSVSQDNHAVNGLFIRFFKNFSFIVCIAIRTET